MLFPIQLEYSNKEFLDIKEHIDEVRIERHVDNNGNHCRYCECDKTSIKRFDRDALSIPDIGEDAHDNQRPMMDHGLNIDIDKGRRDHLCVHADNDAHR